MVKVFNNDAPNALSRHPVHDPQTTDVLAALDMHNHPDMSFREIQAISDQQNESLQLHKLCKHAE